MKEATTTAKQATATVAKGSERRIAARRAVDRPVALRLTDGGNVAPVPAHLIDISASGIGVRLKRPLAPGKQFTIEVGAATKAAEKAEQADKAVQADKPAAEFAGSATTEGETATASASTAGSGGAFALRYQVVWCKPLGHGAFQIGAAFVRTPSPASGKAAPAAAAVTPKRA